jgi:uncharacterized membrane protein YdjX (TVP38/TMEM64 family)
MSYAESDSAGATESSWKPKNLLMALGLLGLVFLLATKGQEVTAGIENFNIWVEELGPLAPVVFLFGYALAVVAFVPGSLLTAAAGALFGLWQGTLVVFIGASLGACSAFLIARYVARDSIEARLGKHPKFRSVDQAIGREGLKITFLLRLSPVFPFTLLNYLLGLSKVSFRDYALACFGMIPGTLLYVYLGKVAGEVLSIAGDAASTTANSNGKSPLEIAFLFFGLAVTVFITVYVTRVARKALQEATEHES